MTYIQYIDFRRITLNIINIQDTWYRIDDTVYTW